MILLDPVNAVTSIAFYRKVAAQTAGRTALYLVYLAAVFALAATAAMRVRVGPAISETFVWLEKSVPPLSFSNGRMSSTLTEPLVLRHPQVPDVAFGIDTNRVEPVTPDDMARDKVMAYLTSNAFYVQQRPGQVEVYDFSKAPQAQPVVIDGRFYRQADQMMGRILYPATLLVAFLVFLAWKGWASLFYSVVALIVNAGAQAELPYGALFRLSVYAQTLVIALQIIFLFMPVQIPFFGFLAVAVTTAYLWLAVKKVKEPEAPLAPAA